MTKGGIPICIFDKDIGMFQIIYKKGKVISSFGVSWATTPTKAKTKVTTMKTSSSSTIKTTTTTCEYLFIEEVLFLHERGLLQVYYHYNNDSNNNDSINNDDNDNNSNNNKDNDDNKPLDTKELYNIMLHQLHIPIQVYLTYSYLRSQTFIVVRHTASRYNLIQDGSNNNSGGIGSTNGENENDHSCITIDDNNNSSNNDNDNDDDCGNGKKKQRIKSDKIKMDLRYDTFHAPIPFVFGYDEEDDDGNDNTLSRITTTSATTTTTLATTSTNKQNLDLSTKIAFDVYQPNSQYRKSNPGLPNFYVCICNLAQPSPPFHVIKNLIRVCNDIPLKVAAIADGGTVIMFGLTDYGVPSLLE